MPCYYPLDKFIQFYWLLDITRETTDWNKYDKSKRKFLAMHDNNYVICQWTNTTLIMICILDLPYNTSFNVK